MSIRSSTIEQGMTGDEMVDIMQDNIAALDAPVTALCTGKQHKHTYNNNRLTQYVCVLSTIHSARFFLFQLIPGMATLVAVCCPRL